MITRMDFPLVIRDMMMAAGSRDVEASLSAMGDDEFRAFYDRTARPLWAYLSRIAGEPHKADDFLQETYYRFYRAAAKYESESHRRNSLFQIATNLVRDAARRNKRYEEVPIEREDGSENVPPCGSPTPDRQVASRADLERGLQQLEPMQRELLWLAYAEGSSHEEIATMLGLKAISIRTLLLRARRKLATILTTGATR